MNHRVSVVSREGAYVLGFSHRGLGFWSIFLDLITHVSLPLAVCATKVLTNLLA